MASAIAFPQPILKSAQALATIQAITTIDEQTNESVSPDKSVGSLEQLFASADPNATIDFGNGHKLIGITIEENCTIKGVSGYKRAKAVFEGNSNAKFEIAYNPATKDCIIENTYRGSLPSWIKFGDQKHWLDAEKGIPTAKVINGLLMAKLGMTKHNVSSFKATCINAQTYVDVIYGTTVQNKTVAKSFAASHTAQLTAELGQILGIAETRLVAIKAGLPGAKNSIEDYLEVTHWSAAERAKFKQQPKLLDLKKLDLDLCAEDEDHMALYEVPFMTDLCFKTALATPRHPPLSRNVCMLHAIIV